MCVFTADGFTGELIECDEGGNWLGVKGRSSRASDMGGGDRVFLNILLSGGEIFLDKAV